MPNNIKNYIRVDSDDWNFDNTFWDLFATDHGAFDFNKIIPTADTVMKADDPRVLSDNEYRWRIDSWGTKWNAYDVNISGDTIHFETAWEHPNPIIKKLSEMWPKVLFWVAYADEDRGFNLKMYQIQNGEIIDSFEFERGSFAGALFADIMHSLEESKN